MSLDPASIDRIPLWSAVVPAAALALAAVLFAGGAGVGPVLLLPASLLMLGTVFAAVRHAEVLALRLGEPYGSILLALAITLIEVTLIVSLMLAGGPGTDTLARDTVYATVMIVLTGIVGGCLLVGGMHHHEQSFRLDSATSALSVLGTIAALSLILPVVTRTTLGPVFAPTQLLAVGLVSIVLYAVFLYVQTTSHREYFAEGVVAGGGNAVPGRRTAAFSLLLLLAGLVAVVLHAKLLSPMLKQAVAAMELPASLVGVVIAAIVLLPEALSALQAARANRLQAALNLVLGSALATIGLTIPIVGFLALYLDLPMVVGLSGTEMGLLLLALYISGISLATGRTTMLQGAVHLGIFAVFLVLAVKP
ncbi:MAG: ionic transporter y4hA [Rubrivivax sp.]|nr:ionic transporter y4hA [Rubrivivax sp.]HOW48604.1 ionic transporter y4hA [Rubrivivax sp.]HRY88459.1 ionic transporter y4hA [Rubrivivax sp.]